MKKVHALILALTAVLFLAGCTTITNIQNNYNSAGSSQNIATQIVTTQSETKTVTAGAKVTSTEDVSPTPVLKDKTDTTVPIQPDTSAAAELNSFDPPGSGYKWVAYKTTGPITAAADETFTLSYTITGVETPHTVTERIRRDGETWGEGGSFQFQIGPETGADTYLYTIAGFLAVVTGTVFLALSLNRRKHPRENQ